MKFKDWKDPHFNPDPLRIAEAFGLEGSVSIEKLDRISLNDLWLVKEGNKKYVLKRYQRHAPLTIDFSARFSAFLATQGLPVSTVIPTREGLNLWLHGGRGYSLFGFLEGHSIDPEHSSRLSHNQVAKLGACLARIHQASAAYQGPKISKKVVESSRTMAVLNSIRRAILRRPSLDEFDRMCLRVIEKRMEVLLGKPFDLSAFSSLPSLVIHGDFHQANVLFDSEGDIVGIIDFEFGSYQPRVWDILWSLTFVCSEQQGEAFLVPIDIYSASIFLRSYMSIERLSPRELETLAQIALSASYHATYFLERYYRKGYAPKGLTPPDRYEDWFWWEHNWMRFDETVQEIAHEIYLS